MEDLRSAHSLTFLAIKAHLLQSIASRVFNGDQQKLNLEHPDLNESRMTQRFTSGNE
jgi:hypothetical protein